MKNLGHIPTPLDLNNTLMNILNPLHQMFTTSIFTNKNMKNSKLTPGLELLQPTSSIYII